MVAPEQTAHKSRITIREMELDDLSRVYELGTELFTSSALPTMYRTWDVYEVTGYFNSDPDYCLVAEDDHHVCGFIMGTTYKKEGTAWTYGYVAWIGVEAEYRRQNTAKRLYQELERSMSAEGVRIMIMDTEAGNKAAVQFFSRMGFGNPRPLVWMSKTLQARKAKLQRPIRKGASGRRPTRATPSELEQG